MGYILRGYQDGQDARHQASFTFKIKNRLSTPFYSHELPPFRRAFPNFPETPTMLHPSHICPHIRCSVSVGVNQCAGYAASTSVLARVKNECVPTKDAARFWLLASESKPSLKDFIVVSAVQTQHPWARDSDVYIMGINQVNVSQNISGVYK